MAGTAGPIEHVVVLMMENNSFDRMLGWLPGIGELDGTQSNQADGKTYPVTKGAGYCTDPCPAHDLADVNLQLFGVSPPAPGVAPTMSGFAANYLASSASPPSAPDPRDVMACYLPEQVPAISALARTFTVCTRWFCSVPGPTGPNRLYANCASSLGYAGTDYLVDQFPADTMAPLHSIFGVLTAAGRTWGVYHQDAGFAPELILADVQDQADSAFVDPGFLTFQGHVQGGTLRDYSFLTPSLWSNSQHAPDDIRNGERLIADVYDVLAASPYWANTLLILTYDEHGGFYDSVPPPGGVPNPDGIDWDANWGGNSSQYAPPPFAFDRLGPRVPAILISPYMPAMVDTRQYEHSSIPATILALFGLSWPDANQRISTVNTFEDRIGDTMRTDLPGALPRPGRPAPAGQAIGR